MDYPAGVELMTDISAAAWVEQRLASWPKPFLFPVGCAIPAGFASYARIFHPIRRGGVEHEEPQRWADFAAERGKVAHAGMQFESLIETVHWQREPWDSMAPEWGALPEGECLTLSEVLRSFTAAPATCWFCLWDGYGQLSEAEHGESLATIPRVRTLWAGTAPDRSAAREYLLFRGPLEAVVSFCGAPWFQSPNLWWPADRSWCVATEVDGFSSFVGGTQAAIDAVLRARGIEALPIDPTQRFDVHSDTVNGLPPDL